MKKSPGNTPRRGTLAVGQLTLLASVLLSALPYAAQAARTADGLETQDELQSLPAITVTSEKIERPLEKVPASVAVIDGWDTEQSGITGMEQLEGRIPGLSFQPFGQAGMNSPVMRGLTANFNSFSTSTLLLVDGVPTLTAQGFEHGMLDLDRIEVMRGPQSTLYGRNAEAGVIAIHSLPLDATPRASVSAQAGSRDKRVMRFALSQPVVEERLYASVSGNWSSQDGFIDNTHTGKKEDDREQRNLNLGLRWTPGAATDLVMRYAHQEYDDGAALWGAPSSPRTRVASGTQGWNRSKGQTLSLNARHEFASGLTLHSVTAWNDFKDRIRQDTDFLPADVLQVGRDHHLRTLSQELRLEGQLGEADWLAGVYADHSDNDLHSTSKTMMGLSDMRADQENHTAALFTHWNVPLSAGWSLAAGARIERNEVELRPRGAVRQDKGWTHVSPKLALQYQLAPDHQWYLSASRGVRSGGFNVLAPTLGYLPYDSEKLWSYESGLKGWLLDKRIRYSLAAYFMDIDDMQVMQMPSVGMMYITSAATATSRGLELDIDYLLGDGWQLKGGLAWNHTRFDRFQDGTTDYHGKHNPFAPDLTGHIGIRYDAPQGWYAQASVTGSGKVYLDAANQYKRNGYGLLNLVAGYQRGQWEIAAYADNATDQRYDAVGYQNGFVTVYSPPREAGLRLTWRL
ncbi:TonB-dependent receptor [Stutzerimonas kirkiae]|uniref:TonB-dependent receptor n=1 Tax=Stutzerimonas kirkiae TaxID=2211392 RepID=UPI001038472F|nr:TonB-dependent receptor [Stutzerimonas kirkiae]TBV16652.1 TonB-dependent receptor [Stutzerimonas kirkiae]